MNASNSEQDRTVLERRFANSVVELAAGLTALYDEFLKEGYLHADSFHYVKRNFPVLQHTEYGVVHSYAARESGTNQFRFLTRKPFARTKGKFVYGSIPLSNKGEFSDSELTKSSYHTNEAELCILTEFEYRRLRHNSYAVKSAIRKLRSTQYIAGDKPQYPKVELKDVPRSSLTSEAEIQSYALKMVELLTSIIERCMEYQFSLASLDKQRHQIRITQLMHQQMSTYDLNNMEALGKGIEPTLSERNLPVLNFLPGRVQVEVMKRKHKVACQFYLREPSVKTGQYVRINLPISGVGYTDKAFKNCANPAEQLVCISTEKNFRMVRHNVSILKFVLSALKNLNWTIPNTSES